MTKTLKDVGETVEKDVLTFASEHTLNAICETAMGTSLHDLNVAKEEYREKIRQLDSLLVYRLLRPWLLSEWLWNLSSAGRLEKKLLYHFHGFTEKIIAERKLYHERTNGRYLQTIEDDNVTETDDVEIYGST
ncbi:PREDICTED: cytochrome P450 4C1-like [Dinoponera quadriceps]|uniref:Cytochrome P450 4C1-like n=1 Tax=Dinoponera quadriceps TaxID=609295 RepID=A0A6P3Y860_DINQU|nr:PREDICTED: cytochrome P450 4C1-like [Dinoponera quadriceps]